MIAGSLDVATHGNKPASAGDIEDTLRHMQEMTRIAEHEMHAVVLFLQACAAGYAGLAAGKKADLTLTACGIEAGDLNWIF